MKSILRTAVVGAVAAAFVASVAIAQGVGPGQGVGRGRGMGGPGPGGRGFGPGMGMMLPDLTEQQREQIRAIHEEAREDGGPADAKLRQQLHAELFADTPNDQKVEELKQQILAAQAGGLARHISVQRKVAQVLTAEQRAKARERSAEGPPQRGRRGGMSRW